MMQVNSDNPEITENTQSKSQAVDLLTGAKPIEGVTSLISNFTENLSQGLVNVDSAMQSFVNQMGQGQGLASEIRAEFAGAAEEVIALGGTQKEAADIQTKTLEVLGRNVILSKEQTKELFAATKISGEEIDVLEKAFINAGKSIKDIGKEMLMVREVANNMGVNAKAVSALVVQNLDKLNRYGFQNGVEGLAKMAASSRALGIDMNETLDLADDLMSPERAMEVAAMFQRMGSSSAALTNPLKLIDLSMNDTAKLQEELGDYFKNFAKFNQQTGQFEIAKSERLKIKQLAQELGISREQIEKMALAGADLDRKLSKISFAGFNVDEETKQMVANMAVMGDKGEYVIKTKAVDKEGKPTGEIIQQSVQEFITSTKGDKEAIKLALGAQQEAATKRPIEDIATEQLDYTKRMQASIDSLVAQPGLTLGASPAGEELLKANLKATQVINEEFQKRLDTDSKISKSLDDFGVKLRQGLTAIDEGEGYQKLFDAFKVQGAELAKTALKELTAGGIEIVSKFGDLTGLKSVFEELELTDDVKEILEEIKKEGKDLSDETIKMIDETLDKINKKEPKPPVEPDNEPKPPVEPDNEPKPPVEPDKEPKPPVEPDKEPDTEKAKETIDKITKKSGEIYDSIKETIFEIFKEITTERIDVNELNVIGETKNNLEQKTSVEEISQVGQTIENTVEKIGEEKTEIKTIEPETPPKTITQTLLSDINTISTQELNAGKLNIITGLESVISNQKVTSTEGGTEDTIESVFKTNVEKISTEIATSSDKTTDSSESQSESIKTFIENNSKELQTSNQTLIDKFQTSLKDVKDLKITTDNTETLKLGGKLETIFTKFEKQSDSVISSVEKNTENQETSNAVLIDKLKSESTDTKDTKITTDNTQTIKLGDNIENLSKEIIKSSEKNFEKFDVRTGKIVQGPEFNRFENFLNENQKGVEKLNIEKTTTDNTETIKLGGKLETVFTKFEKQSDKTTDSSKAQSDSIRTFVENKSKELQTSNQTLSNNFESSLEKIKDLKITTDNTETIKLGNNVENIFTKFENQSDSVKSVLEKNSKSTDIFTELANTNKTILEKTKDEGTNVNTSILNENTDTFINKINEGVEIANKTEEKNNQLSEIQNTITDKDFEKRVLMSESIIRDLDIAKKQLEINTENALLTENEQLNIERLSDTKQSDFEKRVTESEELIKFLDKQIEKQKRIEISSTNVNESLNEQISKIAESNKDFTTISKTNEDSKTTETNVINPSPIQLTDLSLGDTNFKGLDIKIQDFLSKQTEQNTTATASNEPLKIETKLTIDGDPRFASLLDPRQLQRTVEDVMVKSIGKPQFAQKISTGTQNASMGMT